MAMPLAPRALTLDPALARLADRPCSRSNAAPTRRCVYLGCDRAIAEALGVSRRSVVRYKRAGITVAMAERIAQKPLFALKLVKQAVNAAQDAQGRVSAMQTSFALHHLAHAHNMIAHGRLVDPTGLMPAIKKHEKASD